MTYTKILTPYKLRCTLPYDFPVPGCKIKVGRSRETGRSCATLRYISQLSYSSCYFSFSAHFAFSYSHRNCTEMETPSIGLNGLWGILEINYTHVTIVIILLIPSRPAVDSVLLSLGGGSLKLLWECAAESGVMGGNGDTDRTDAASRGSMLSWLRECCSAARRSECTQQACTCTHKHIHTRTHTRTHTHTSKHEWVETVPGRELHACVGRILVSVNIHTIPLHTPQD